MAEEFLGRPGGNYTCRCGAVYEVSYLRLPDRNIDKAACDCCGEELASWNDTVIPKFRQVSPSKGGNAKKPPSPV